MGAPLRGARVARKLVETATGWLVGEYNNRWWEAGPNLVTAYTLLALAAAAQSAAGAMEGGGGRRKIIPADWRGVFAQLPAGQRVSRARREP